MRRRVKMRMKKVRKKRRTEAEEDDKRRRMRRKRTHLWTDWLDQMYPMDLHIRYISKQ